MLFGIRSGLTAAIIAVGLISSLLTSWAAPSAIHLDWFKDMTDVIQGESSSLKAVADASGNVYAVGANEFGWGSLRGFVRKYDGSGRPIWTKTIGADSTALGVAIDRRNQAIYVVGTSNGELRGEKSAGGRDAFIRKYDLNGEKRWTRQFGSSNSDYALAVECGPDGAVYVAGTTEGALPKQRFYGGKGDVFIRKFTAGGRAKWIKQFGTRGLDVAMDVAISRRNEIYLAGSTTRKLPHMKDRGGSDAYLRRYSANGKVIWTKQFSGSLDDLATNVAIDSDRRVYVAGISGARGFVRKYTPNGYNLWSHRVDRSPIWGSAIDRMNRIYLTGYSLSPLAGSRATAIIFSSNGKRLGGQKIPGSIATGIALDDDGHAFAVGTQGFNYTIAALISMTKHDRSDWYSWLAQFATGPSSGFIAKIN